MNHLGDITQIRGDAVSPVDVIIGGSPCQDLSVAGKRAGLAGERSGLYMEQIRIIKEMRSNVRADGHLRGRQPRYMVWENVPGAFSSNGGEDFRAVLEEAAHIIEPECVIPRPENGKWTNAGCIMGDGWSIAWRVHDAQFWGVPQRRRRIALVADFGGGSAPEILFEREGMRGGPTQSGAEGQGIAADAEGCAGAADEPIGFKYHQGAKAGNIGAKPGTAPTMHADGGHPPAIALVNRGYYRDDGTGETIRAGCHSDTPCVVYNEESVTSKTNASNPAIGDPCHTLGATGAARTICIQGNVVDRDANCNGKGWRDDDVSFALNTVDRPAVCTSGDDVADTLDASYYKGCGERGFKERTVVAANCRNGTESADINGTLQAKSTGGMSLNLNNVVRTNRIVRRLTPLECERLQGYPDGWTDIGEWVDSKGKRHQTTDSARYKALGNSIALPYWRYLLKRISAQFEYTPTMASLFDGIGGFPYLWEGINGKGTCLWASEIEEFPMAVTKLRIGE